jgi:GNAT superfamily N-acetyltransferase
MNLEVRLARPEDGTEVSEVHASTIDRWVRYLPSGKPTESSGEELTPFERILNGGPWMDPGACSLHLRQVVGSGQRPLVAVGAGGRVVGELELIIGPDPRWGRLAHIDVMAVRRDVQRTGVGRELLKAARRLAIEARCSLLSTNPEDAAVGFYRRCGLTTELARQREVEFPARIGDASHEEAVPGEPLERFESLERLELRLGRFQTSYATWIKSRWTLPGLTDRLRREEGRLPELGARYRVSQHALRPASASVYAWTPRGRPDLPRLLRALARRAAALGYDALRTTVDAAEVNDCASFAGSIGAESVLLGDRVAAGEEVGPPSRPRGRAGSRFGPVRPAHRPISPPDALEGGPKALGGSVASEASCSR